MSPLSVDELLVRTECFTVVVIVGVVVVVVVEVAVIKWVLGQVG